MHMIKVKKHSVWKRLIHDTSKTVHSLMSGDPGILLLSEV